MRRFRARQAEAAKNKGKPSVALLRKRTGAPQPGKTKPKLFVATRKHLPCCGRIRRFCGCGHRVQHMVAPGEIKAVVQNIKHMEILLRQITRTRPVSKLLGKISFTKHFLSRLTSSNMIVSTIKYINIEAK